MIKKSMIILMVFVTLFSSFVMAPSEDEPRNILYLDRISLDEIARPGDLVEFYLTLENLQSYDLEDVKIRILDPELGIYATTGSFDIDGKDVESRIVQVDLPADIEPGDHTFRIIISNDNVKRVLHRSITIV